MQALIKATFDIAPAGCMSCKRAIEHAGRHIEEVEDINVDIGTHKIEVLYQSSGSQVPEQIEEIVQRIGYQAELESKTEGSRA